MRLTAVAACACFSFENRNPDDKKIKTGSLSSKLFVFNYLYFSKF
jgi:hypothetical protein